MGVRRGEGWGRRLVARTFTLKVRKKEEQIYRNYNEQTYKSVPLIQRPLKHVPANYYII